MVTPAPAAPRARSFVTALMSFTALTLVAGVLGGAAPARADRLQQILESRTLRVCIWPDYYGISFRNPKTQQLAGIDIDNAHTLARALGVGVQFVDSSFARLVDDVLAERCDIAMFAIGITPQRQEKLRFTQPYLASDIYAITSKAQRRIQRWEDIDQPGVVVAVAKGTLHEPIMKAKLRAAELRVFDTPQAREQEVQSGRADVFMTDFPFSRRMLANNEWARLVAPTQTYHVTPYAWALKPGDDRFFARVETELTKMKRDGRILNHARRHGLDPIVVQ